MKKIKNLSEGDFLKLLFGFFAVAFLIGAVCMPDRAQMLSGLGAIVSNPAKLSTNYFELGGYAATFLNIALTTAICLGLFLVCGGTPNAGSTLAVLLTTGFSSWGINILNMWPTIFGVVLYGLVKKEKLGGLVNAMIFSTGIAPIISEMLVRYPNADVIGFNLPGLLIALVVGFAIGFFLPAGLAHSPKVHKGFDLYSAALPIGMTAFFLNAIFYKTLGIGLPAAPDASTLQVASTAVANLFCIPVFGLCVVFALLLGCTPKDYWKVLTCKDQVTSLSTTYGTAAFLMNVGVFGLFILAYYNIIGTPFNAITFGLIFCMLCTCNSGSHPGNVWPIILGYVIASFVFGGLSALAGGTFGEAINAQAIAVGVCFANGLSPICDKYGWKLGALSGVLHYLLVTSVPNLHGGFCLYNGGFTAALVCLVLVPQLEKFCKTRAEKLEANAK